MEGLCLQALSLTEQRVGFRVVVVPAFASAGDLWQLDGLMRTALQQLPLSWAGWCDACTEQHHPGSMQRIDACTKA